MNTGRVKSVLQHKLNMVNNDMDEWCEKEKAKKAKHELM